MSKRKRKPKRNVGYLIQAVYLDRYENLASTLEEVDAESMMSNCHKECSKDKDFVSIRIREINLTGPTQAT